jgi:hypothetical protein
MSFDTVISYLENDDLPLLRSWRAEADAKEQSATGFRKQMFKDWVGYFDSLIELNVETVDNPPDKQILQERFVCEIKGGEEAVSALKKHETSGNCKRGKHIKNLWKVIDLENKSNHKMLTELKKK